jgi:DNA (cytosine-5)-methyltransferase 1
MCALNEIDKWACQTLRKNRPNWKVMEGDIKALIFLNIIIKLMLLLAVFLVKRLVMQAKN